jgi:hypothetical protein
MLLQQPAIVLQGVLQFGLRRASALQVRQRAHLCARLKTTKRRQTTKLKKLRHDRGRVYAGR